jgi:hypothetical protein
MHHTPYIPQFIYQNSVMKRVHISAAQRGCILLRIPETYAQHKEASA